MSFIKDIYTLLIAGQPGMRFMAVSEALPEVLTNAVMHDIEKEISTKLADKYVEIYGDEILKAVQKKTIDHKVISKVVESLLKETGREK